MVPPVVSCPQTRACGKPEASEPAQRTLEIWTFVFSFVFKRLALNLKWTYWGKFSEEARKARLLQQAVWLREGLLRLGPTFIKARALLASLPPGPVCATLPLVRCQQAPTRPTRPNSSGSSSPPASTFWRQSSSRRGRLCTSVTPLMHRGMSLVGCSETLLPRRTQELEKLQDRVPPFNSATAVSIVEEQLGGKVDALFQDFERTPIAAASLGQVHRARLNGERVVVKVQRPGLRELFEIDLKNLRVIAQWLQKVDPKTDGAARDWVAIFDECKTVLLQEIDYTNEGRNADAFRTNFAGTPWVKVPRIFWEQSGQRVLTMEYCPGLKINRVEEIESFNLDRELLARYSVEAYLQQILRFGLFHADPHPGNIAVDAGNPGGRLIF